MTRKDYVKFAAMFKQARQDYAGSFSKNVTGCANSVLDNMQHQMADIFTADNPNFDRQRFLDACEVNA